MLTAGLSTRLEIDVVRITLFPCCFAAGSLPPMPMMVNGFDHKPLERHSSAFSDFDDEMEDYPKEVRQITNDH